MHKLNIAICGPENFLTTLNELKPFLKFNFFSIEKTENYDGFIYYENYSNDSLSKVLSDKTECFKILATNDKLSMSKSFEHVLNLPTTISELNNLIESSSAKQQFNKNSSIKIKTYFLDKNEKKLIKVNKSIILTEKEIKLLELFLKKKEPISKDLILSKVWNYSSEADTHTVETHIYRLRKKINDKFLDEKFIKNNKKGYYL